jgi:hypothetical protein
MLSKKGVCELAFCVARSSLLVLTFYLLSDTHSNSLALSTSSLQASIAEGDRVVGGHIHFSAFAPLHLLPAQSDYIKKFIRV